MCLLACLIIFSFWAKAVFYLIKSCLDNVKNGLAYVSWVISSCLVLCGLNALLVFCVLFVMVALFVFVLLSVVLVLVVFVCLVCLACFHMCVIIKSRVPG